MARNKTIKFFRGAKASLPALQEGEPGFCTDTGELYVGTANGNVLVSGAFPDATAAQKGGVKLGSDVIQTIAMNAAQAVASRTYPIQKDANGQLVVNVPWANDNTTYTTMTQSEATTGTATTARVITAKVLADTIAAKGGDAISAHAAKLINTVDGVHGVRYWEDKLQILNGSTWEDADDGGGGIPVGDCTAITLTVGNAQLKIAWQDPVDTVVSGSTLAQWATTKLVRKAGSYPTSPTDGTLVLTNTVRNQYQNGYTDSGLSNGTTYYYKLFPISATNAVNTNATNNISGTPQPFKTFGVSIDLSNSNPSTSVTYTDDAVGMTGGSSNWDSQTIFKDIKPCLLLNGVVQAYLNPADFTKKANGTAADITSGNAGDVMIEFPKTGVKIATSGNTLTVQITDDPNKSGFHYYAHTRTTEGDRSKLYVGAYKGNTVSSKLRSLSGKAPTASQTIGTFRTQAQANGSGYDQMSFYPLTLLQCLYLIRFKSLDSQTALGQGYTGGSAVQNTGATNTNGMYYGSTSTTRRVKCFGIEDLWGNIYEFIDGLFSDASRNIMTAFTSFNDTGSGYTSRGQGATANIGNYMSKPQGTSETGFIAKEVSGSSSTYFSDYAYLSASCIPAFGGYYGIGALAGVFLLYVYFTASATYASVGGRLMYL